MATGIAIAGLVLAAAGTAASIDASRKAAAFNEKALRQQSERASAISGLEADEFARDSKRLRSTQLAKLAASGVTIGTGTALLLEEETAAEGKFQELVIRAGGRSRADALGIQSQIAGLEGRRAAIAGASRIGTTLLGASQNEALFGGNSGPNTTGPISLAPGPATPTPPSVA